jgi:L-fuculose-phosphate aldolase
VSRDEVRREIVEACKRLEANSLVQGASGNVSVRLPAEDGRALFAITPSGRPYRILEPQDILVIDAEGNVVEGEGKPSSEKNAHLTAYRVRADVNAVIHSHSVYASALAVAGIDLPCVLDEQVVAIGGPVRVAEFGMSASQDLADKAMAAMEQRQAVFLRSHGVLGVGRTLDEVLDVVAMVERTAKIYVLARLLGDAPPLPQPIVDIEEKWYKITHGFPTEG